jgi:SAM-dependent methyltransferase
MAVDTHPASPAGAGEHLARTLLRALDYRRQPLDFTPVEGRIPTAEAWFCLHRHARLHEHTDLARPGLLAPVFRLVRRVLRKLLGPWLEFQATFNEAVISLLEGYKQVLQGEKEARESLEGMIHAFEERYLQALNRELAGQGALAQAGLWFNPAVQVRMGAAGPRVAGVSPRILEHVFVHTRLPRPPARVLDLGWGESTNALEMAGLGFEVVGVGPREVPLSHPSLTQLKADPASLPFPDGSFDLAVAQGAGGAADRPVIDEVHRVLRPGGRLLLTAPLARAGLEELAGRFAVVERAFGVPEGESWSFTADERRLAGACGGEGGGAVALMVLEKPADAPAH